VIRRIYFWILALVLALLFTARPVLAHDGEPHGNGEWWTYWVFNPQIILGLTAAAALYFRGWQTLKQRPGGLSALRRKQTWAFAAGMTALAACFISPIDGLAEQLFWVHMLQHVILMLAAAPLLVLSYPLPPLLLGLPERTRQSIGRIWSQEGWLRAAWRGLSQPLVVWLLHTGLLWLWHTPGVYQASVENELVHALQHFSFLGSALLFWWAALHTYGASAERRGLGILYLFTTMLQSGLLGALITFSPSVWYPVYAERAAEWGLSALEDQQIAGLIMWIPAGIIYLAAALYMMKTWLSSIQPDEESAPRRELK